MKVITIGRSSDSDIVVNDAYVSRHHCLIKMDDGGNLYLIDLQSQNGVFVNGQQIQDEIILKSTDIVRVGHTTLSYNSFLDALLVKEGKNPPNMFPPQDTAMCYSVASPEWIEEEEAKTRQMQQHNPRIEGQVNGEHFNSPITELRTSIYIDDNGLLHIKKTYTNVSEISAIQFEDNKFTIIDYTIELKNRKWKKLKDGDVIKIQNTVFTFRCDNSRLNKIK